MRKLWPLVDLAFILLFVVIGRSSHRHGESAGGLISTTWPFAVALAVGWVITLRRGRRGDAPLEGLVIVLITVALGMVLRVLSGQGTAFAFILVAIAFLSLFLVGARLVVRTARRRVSRH